MFEANQINLIDSLVSIDQLTPSELAALLKFLISKELSPSGPYLLSDTVNENKRLNTKVYTLFAKKDKILSGTFTYIQLQDDTLSPLRQKETGTSDTFVSELQLTHNNLYKQSSKHLTPELYEHVAPILDTLSKRDSNGEITQLSSAFISSLRSIPDDKPTEKRITLLGHANFYTWAAYSLYDASLDNPEHDPLNIPAANIFQRLALTTYISAGIPFEKLIYNFGGVDKANADEIANTRVEIKDEIITIAKIPPKKNLHKLLSSRSSIHCLGPLNLAANYSDSRVHYQKSKSIFNTYCAARQLSDDIHDWEEDISNGHISYVVAHLLKTANIKDGNHNLVELITKLRLVFWENELVHLVNECLDMCKDVKQAYVHYLNLKEDSLFEQITLNPIVGACQSAKNSIQYSKQFLQEIRSHS